MTSNATTRPAVPPAVSKLRERLQQEARERRVLENALRRLAEQAGLRSHTAVVDHDLAAPDGRTTPYREPGDTVTAQTAAVGSFWPRPGETRPPALVATPGRACYASKDRTSRVIGMIVMGRSRAQLTATLATVAAKQIDRPDFTPIFFTDSEAFDLFREHGFVFEYLPPEARRTRGASAWLDYVASRVSQARAMWGVTDMIEIPVEGPLAQADRSDVIAA